MLYVIKRHLKSNREATIVKVPARGQLRQQVMGEDVAELEFTYGKRLNFRIGDFVEVLGSKYVLNQKPSVQKVSKKEYLYNLTFEGPKYDLAKVQLMFPDTEENLTIADFSIVANADRLLDLIVQNANRVQSGWQKGICEETETKNVTFNSNNLLQALSMIADEFNLEYWIDGKTIHLANHTVDRKRVFKYGFLKGLKSITRQPYDSSNIVTRLYAYGSTKNLPQGYLGKRLTLTAPLDANIDKYGVVEHTEIFEDIYPHRLGTVTAVDNDFMSFIDEDIDFDLNATDEEGNTLHLIDGVSAKVTFNTGQLAGYTFEIKKHGFDFESKRITLLKNEQEEHLDIPSETLRPAVGDRYIITDIMMPESYVEQARQELQDKAKEYLEKNSRPQFQYNIQSDSMYFRHNGIQLKLGERIRIVDYDLNIDIKMRVSAMSIDLQNIFYVEITLADKISQNEIIRSYLQAEKQNTVIAAAQQFNAKLARLSYMFSQELFGNIFDSDGYFNPERIRPLSIETKMLAVGSRLQQFSLPGVVMQMVNNRIFKNTAGELVHLTINDDNTPRTWSINSDTIYNLGNAFYYIYAKCSRTASAGEIILSPDQIMVTQDPDWFYFEVGFLSSVIDGVRRIKTTYGFSTINGGEITTGRIHQQSTGQLFIDIDNRKIVGDVTFLPGTNSYNRMKKIENKTDFLNSTTISGSVVATGTMLVGNEDGVNAGITGTGDDNDVFLWAGTNYSNRSNAPVKITRNGNASITGHIEATSGKIGRGNKYFEIYDKGIKSEKGWIFLGSPNYNKDFVQIQPGNTGTSDALVSINNRSSSNYGKVALSVSCSGSSNSNNAIVVNGAARFSGPISINEDNGITKDILVHEFQVGPTKRSVFLQVKHGLIIGTKTV